MVGDGRALDEGKRRGESRKREGERGGGERGREEGGNDLYFGASESIPQLKEDLSSKSLLDVRRSVKEFMYWEVGKLDKVGL